MSLTFHIIATSLLEAQTWGPGALAPKCAICEDDGIWTGANPTGYVWLV